MDVRKLVGRNVRQYRKRARVSQEELAHQAGLDRTYVSGIERGVGNPSVLVLQEIAGVLQIRPADLLAEVDDMAVKLADSTGRCAATDEGAPGRDRHT
jgi:transcriptional regulator with XRE-family HTH domain